MNVYRKELAMMRTSLLWWCAGFVVMLGVFMSIYPAFSQDAETSRELIARFPEALRTTLDINLSTFLTFIGFYVYLFTFIMLAGAIQATNVGLSLLSKEVEAKTVDFLLTKPISRTKVFVSKLAAGATGMLITSTVLTTTAFVGAELSGAEYSLDIFLLVNMSFFLLQLVFMSFGMLVSQLLGRVRSDISLSLGMAFTFFVISLIASFTGDEKYRYLTPFQFFDWQKLVREGAYSPESYWLVAGSCIVAIVVSYMIYAHRDARAVS